MKKLLKLLLFSSLFLFLSLYIKADTAREEIRLTPILNREYLNNCLSLIDKAKNSISIACLYFKEDRATDKIVKALRKALKRNVKVRIILDGSIPENENILKKLSSFGVETKSFGPENKLHAKFIVVDSVYCLLGSTNFSAKSIEENNETNLLINNPAVSGIYEKFFESLWDSEKKFKTSPFLLLGPNEKAIPVLSKDYFPRALSLISHAKKNIAVILYMAHFMPQYYSSKPNRLLRALIEARRKGLNVRVIFEKSDHDKNLNEINRSAFEYLLENKVAVKYDTPKVITHAKLLLCDDSVLLGSTNWAISSLGKNKEADILIRDKECVEEYRKYFENLWKEY